MNEDSLKHGAFGWNELMPTDPEAAKQFYTALFGWETEEAPMEVTKGSDIFGSSSSCGQWQKINP